MKARTDEQVLSGLLARTAPIPFSGCHIWMGSCMANGYGQIGYRGKNAAAHRVSWLLQRGPIPEGMSVLHRCDIRCCVNPEHLFLGTALDNVRDMVSKGRQRMDGVRGEQNPMRLYQGILSGGRHGMARLTENDVSEIRRRYADGETQKRLADAFGVNQTHISRIVRRESWTTTEQ